MPLYGWLFPETKTRVNIGICMDGQGTSGEKTERNVRDVFARFVADHYAPRLRNATQIGKLKGHPISYTTWIEACTVPGALYVGEAARVTHNATGEGISQAMQSGLTRRTRSPMSSSASLPKRRRGARTPGSTVSGSRRALRRGTRCGSRSARRCSTGWPRSTTSRSFARTSYGYWVGARGVRVRETTVLS